MPLFRGKNSFLSITSKKRKQNPKKTNKKTNRKKKQGGFRAK